MKWSAKSQSLRCPRQVGSPHCNLASVAYSKIESIALPSISSENVAGGHQLNSFTSRQYLNPRKNPTEDPYQVHDDIIIVDFDGPDDPEKAVNWSNGRKWAIIAVLSLMTFTT